MDSNYALQGVKQFIKLKSHLNTRRTLINVHFYLPVFPANVNLRFFDKLDSPIFLILKFATLTLLATLLLHIFVNIHATEYSSENNLNEFQCGKNYSIYIVSTRSVRICGACFFDHETYLVGWGLLHCNLNWHYVRFFL